MVHMAMVVEKIADVVLENGGYFLLHCNNDNIFINIGL